MGYYLIQKKNRPLIYLFFVLYASLIYIIGFIVSPQIIYSRSIRDPNIYPKARINSWDLLDLKGNSYSFEKVRGKVVLLNFTWKGCGQCIQKQPFTNILKQKYKSNNRLIILEVDLGKFDTMEDAIAFSKKGNKNLLWVYDPQNKLAERLLFEGAPHEVLIDSKGHIDFISAGFNKDISLIYLQEISQKIDKALLEIRNN